MRIAYDNIEKIMIGNDTVYIFINSIQAAIVPFTVFKTEQEKNEFIHFIN